MLWDNSMLLWTFVKEVFLLTGNILLLISFCSKSTIKCTGYLHNFTGISSHCMQVHYAFGGSQGQNSKKQNTLGHFGKS